MNRPSPHGKVAVPYRKSALRGISADRSGTFRIRQKKTEQPALRRYAASHRKDTVFTPTFRFAPLRPLPAGPDTLRSRPVRTYIIRENGIRACNPSNTPRNCKKFSIRTCGRVSPRSAARNPPFRSLSPLPPFRTLTGLALSSPSLPRHFPFPTGRRTLRTSSGLHAVDQVHRRHSFGNRKPAAAPSLFRYTRPRPSSASPTPHAESGLR